jgi:hypothetical protein
MAGWPKDTARCGNVSGVGDERRFYILLISGKVGWKSRDIHDRYLSRRDTDLLKPPASRGLSGPLVVSLAYEPLRIWI